MAEDPTDIAGQAGDGNIASFASRSAKPSNGHAKAKPINATIDQATAKVRDAIGQAADQAAAAVSKLGVQAKDAYGRAADGAQTVAKTVDPFVHERPYASAGVALGVGVILGLLLAGRGTKVIFVKGVG